MATIEKDVAKTRQTWLVFVVLVVLAIGVGIALYFGLRSPPQMGTSEEVFNTVDALYTAVRNEDEKRVADCEQRLRTAHETGKLPAEAWETLRGIIAKTKSGRWQSAAEALYAFMKGQRREGVLEHTHEHDKKGKTATSKTKASR